MAENPKIQPYTLRQVLTDYFSEEEFKNLCHDLDVDHENLPAQGKAGKARELVRLLQRMQRLDALVAAVQRQRPHLTVNYSPDRVKELKQSIWDALDPPARADFQEFNVQIDAYLNEFNGLHAEMLEWKEVHNLLQDLQNYFAPCRSYIYEFGRLRQAANPDQERDRLLYQIEVEWRPCKRVLKRLQTFAETVMAIGAEDGSAPDWSTRPNTAAKEIDRALFAGDLLDLRENLSEFGDVVDQYLYLADKALLRVATDIMQLPRPGSHAVNAL